MSDTRDERSDADNSSSQSIAPVEADIRHLDSGKKDEEEEKRKKKDEETKHTQQSRQPNNELTFFLGTSNSLSGTLAAFK